MNYLLKNKRSAWGQIGVIRAHVDDQRAEHIYKVNARGPPKPALKIWSKRQNPLTARGFFAVLKDAPCETSIFENRGCQKHEDLA